MTDIDIEISLDNKRPDDDDVRNKIFIPFLKIIRNIATEVHIVKFFCRKKKKTPVLHEFPPGLFCF